MTRQPEHGVSAGARSGDRDRRDTTIDPRRGEALGEVLEHLERLLRAYAIYSPDHEIARRFKADFRDRLLQALAGGGEVCLEVKANSVLLGETVVFREDPDGSLFVFGLHRDGVRRLVLLPGLTAQEIDRLADALSADLQDPRNFDKDRVTLLREAELVGLRAVVAEVMGEDDPGDSEQTDQYRGLMNAIIDAATEAHLPAGYEARLNEKVVRVASQALAEITPEQIATTLSMADDTGSVDAFSDEEYRRRCVALQQQYENPTAMLRKFTEVLFRGLARSGPDNPAPLTTFDLLSQSLVKSGRYADLLEIASLLLSLRQGPHAGAAATADLLLRTLLKAERLASLVKVLDSDVDRASVGRLLQLLPADRWPELVTSALGLSAEGRESIVELLAGWARADLRALAGLLSSSGEPESKLLIQAMQRVGSERALAALAPLRHHHSPNIRFELLRATRACASPAIRNARLGLLADENTKVRAEAEACLLLNRDPELLRWLERRLRSGELDEASLVEKRRVCELLGSRGGGREAELLRMLLERGSGTLARRHLAETAAAAAHGLAVTGDRAHLALLEREASRRLGNRALRNACREALERLRSIIARPDTAGAAALASSSEPGTLQASSAEPTTTPSAPPLEPEPAAGGSAAAPQRAPAVAAERSAPAPAPAPADGFERAPAAAAAKTGEVDDLLKSFLKETEDNKDDSKDNSKDPAVDDLLRGYLADSEREPR